jgi:glycosyltransferase involved in cell wall biosynthesis
MRQIHLINPMECASGGSEHRTLGLFETLASEADVAIWSEGAIDPWFAGRYPILSLNPGRHPRAGTFVFVGTYFGIGGWARLAKPDRVVVIHNIDQPERLRETLASFERIGYPKPDVVFASSGTAERTFDIPGIVQISPIDISRFAPNPATHPEFTVGRMSRDAPIKHHPEDVELYRLIAESGSRVRMMGGTCLGCDVPGVEVLPENGENGADFLRSLDVFVYRTHPNWYETFGRVVFEAMATGLPVIVEPRHGFAEWLTDGENALFAETTTEILGVLARLRDEPEFRRALGANARAVAERMFGAEYLGQIQKFYLG